MNIANDLNYVAPGDLDMADFNLDDFDIDVRVGEPTQQDMDLGTAGFLSFGATCWSCHATCYSECCPTGFSGKFCSSNCSC